MNGHFLNIRYGFWKAIISYRTYMLINTAGMLGLITEYKIVPIWYYSLSILVAHVLYFPKLRRYPILVLDYWIAAILLLFLADLTEA